jgi:dTDP-L-rhamnose 4-epimerase
MPQRVLITGGAGFIGSHVVDELLRHDYEVRALDNLSSQVHGSSAVRPAYLDADVELLIGDVRDGDTLGRALRGVEAVVHLAAAVGVGQSMYQVDRYTAVNNLGTAVLLQQIIDRPVSRLVVASSMSIYGEGLYRSSDGRLHNAAERSLEQLRACDWELHGSDGEVLSPVPTPETKPPSLTSVYALSKFDQERLCLLIGRAYDIPTVALRFFNVFGTRQALSNPYTGVLAIFASRLLNGNAPLIFEDGLQQRDFVSVRDVAVACRLALETPAAAGGVFNIGSGRARSILEIAELMATALRVPHIEPHVTGKYRFGDIRHCVADISLASRVLGYQPRIGIEEGLIELSDWLEGQIPQDKVAEATTELASRGLTI